MLDFSDRTRTGISKLISRCAQAEYLFPSFSGLAHNLEIIMRTTISNDDGGGRIETQGQDIGIFIIGSILIIPALHVTNMSPARMSISRYFDQIGVGKKQRPDILNLIRLTFDKMQNE